MKIKKMKEVLVFILTMVMAMTLIVPVSAKTNTSNKKVYVTNQKELNAALKNSAASTIIIKTQGKLNLKIGKFASKANLVVNAPNATISNNSKFKSIEIKNLAKFVEKSTQGNSVIVNDKDLTITIGKNAKDVTVKADKAGASLEINVKGGLNKLVISEKANVDVKGTTNETINIVNKAEGSNIDISVDSANMTLKKSADLAISEGCTIEKLNIQAESNIVIEEGASVEQISISKTEGNVSIVADGTVGQVDVNSKVDMDVKGSTDQAIPINVNAKAKIETSVQTQIQANASADISFNEGAEGSNISTGTDVSVEVKNETKEEISIKDETGKENKVDAGKEVISDKDGITEKKDDATSKDNNSSSGGSGGSSSGGSSSGGNSKPLPTIGALVSFSTDGDLEVSGFDKLDKINVKVDNETFINIVPKEKQDSFYYYIITASAINSGKGGVYNIEISAEGYNSKTINQTRHVRPEKFYLYDWTVLSRNDEKSKDIYMSDIASYEFDKIYPYCYGEDKYKEYTRVDDFACKVEVNTGSGFKYITTVNGKLNNNNELEVDNKNEATAGIKKALEEGPGSQVKITYNINKTSNTKSCSAIQIFTTKADVAPEIVKVKVNGNEGVTTVRVGDKLEAQAYAADGTTPAGGGITYSWTQDFGAFNSNSTCILNTESCSKRITCFARKGGLNQCYSTGFTVQKGLLSNASDVTYTGPVIAKNTSPSAANISNVIVTNGALSTVVAGTWQFVDGEIPPEGLAASKEVAVKFVPDNTDVYEVLSGPALKVYVPVKQSINAADFALENDPSKLAVVSKGSVKLSAASISSLSGTTDLQVKVGNAAYVDFTTSDVIEAAAGTVLKFKVKATGTSGTDGYLADSDEVTLTVDDANIGTKM